ncbi:alpha/beta fold hydrolase [Sulfurirhabdus autotrophica]|uniref:Pimeloyl-ACP methyl ester carboxylesterase n=1 Tax=Sulfurirhabdus autotrophica TaxID=1706046 RepID=A0A4R3Y924_9PROT|nr:alpha/beta hydrolase [Sulfurirhabdus autotrophica]TCV87468.1 pimeloyl-ACP methyl ester carboxylesterase [Sulfurirhabdus autotrophica]
MDSIIDIAPGVTGSRDVLVLLPGAKDRPQDFVGHGFIQAVRERNLPIDVVAVDAHVDYYLEGNIVETLRHDIISALQEKKYCRIWVLGISIGGLGALSFARKYPALVEGVFLLAPFLGVRGTIAEVVRAGGLNNWNPGYIAPEDHERERLAWLKTFPSSEVPMPNIYLGYGKEDRYAPASILLAERLPPHHVLALNGGHDWQTWIALWRGLLDKDILPRLVVREQK